MVNAWLLATPKARKNPDRLPAASRANGKPRCLLATVGLSTVRLAKRGRRELASDKTADGEQREQIGQHDQ